MSEAASIGADTALWCASQFTRMPWGVHDNGVVQRVIYFARDRFNLYAQ